MNFDVLSGTLKFNAQPFVDGAARAATAFQNLSGKLTDLGRRMGESLSKMGEVAHRGLSNVGTAATGLAAAFGVAAAASLKLASDANEAASKFEFVFTTATDKTRKALDKFAEVAQRSKYTMREMAADIGALIGPMGFTADKTGELSTEFAKLAVDLSSFYNLSEKDALIALRAAIVGESEPMRRMGVMLNEAKIQAEAFALGIAKSKAEVTGAVKTQAIYSIIMRETKTAQGDAVRTAGAYANSFRGMSDAIKDARTDLGQAFIPAAIKAVQAIRAAAKPVADWAAANQTLLKAKVSEWADRIALGAANLGKTAYAVFEYLKPAMLQTWDYAGKLWSSFRQWFATLPEGVQHALKLGAALAAGGIALEKVGGAIPIVGQFATALGSLMNPLNALGGGLKMLSGAGGLVFSITQLGGAFATLLPAVTGLVGPALAILGPAAPFIIGAAAVGALAVAIDHFAFNGKGLNIVLTELGKTAREVFAGGMNVAKGAVEALQGVIGGDEAKTAAGLATASGGLSGALGSLAHRIASVFPPGPARTTLMALSERLRDNAKAANEAAQALRNISKGIADVEEKRAARAKVIDQYRKETEESKQKVVDEQREQEYRASPKQAQLDVARKKNDLEGLREFRRQDQETIARIGVKPKTLEEADALDKAMKNLEATEKKIDTAEADLAKAEEALKKVLAERAEAEGKGKEAGVLSPQEIQRQGAIEHAREMAKTAAGQAGQGQGAGDLRSRRQEEDAALRQARHEEDIARGPAADKFELQQQRKAEDEAIRNKRQDEDRAAAQAKREEQQAKKEEERKSKEETKRQEILNPEAAKKKREEEMLIQHHEYLGVAHDIIEKGRGAVKEKIAEEKKTAKGTTAEARKGLGATAATAEGQAALGKIHAFSQEVMRAFKIASQATGQEKEESLATAMELQKALRDMANAAKLGDKGLKAFNKAAEKAGELRKKLNDLEQKQLDEQNKKAQEQFAAAHGLLTQWQAEAQAKAKQAMEAAVQQAGDSLKALTSQAFGGGQSSVNALIEQAKQAGDPLKAIDLVIGNIKSKVQQAYANLQAVQGSGTGSPFGIQQGTGNLEYLMSTPAGSFIKSLLDTLSKLEGQRRALVDNLAHPKPVPHLAGGAVVQQPTYALVGEQGPEAVLPLERLANVMQQVVGAQFPLGAGGWNVGQNFSQLAGWFANAQSLLNQSDLLGNAQGSSYWAGVLKNLGSMQDRALAALVAYQQHQQINLQPSAGSHIWGNLLRSGAPAPPWMHAPGLNAPQDPFVPQVTVNIHGADLTTPAGAQQVVDRIVPHLSNAMKRMGRDAHGFNALTRAPTVGPHYTGSPTGYAR